MAVSGKDRAALMMGGHVIDQVGGGKNNGFHPRKAAASPPAVAENAAVAKLWPPARRPSICRRSAPRSEGAITAGTCHGRHGQLPLAKDDATASAPRPGWTSATLDLATKLVDA
jgi:hypothetical protein